MLLIAPQAQEGILRSLCKAGNLGCGNYWEDRSVQNDPLWGARTLASGGKSLSLLVLIGKVTFVEGAVCSRMASTALSISDEEFTRSLLGSFACLAACASKALTLTLRIQRGLEESFFLKDLPGWWGGLGNDLSLCEAECRWL